MSNTDYENFQACWTKFSTQLKGKMIIQAKKEVFNYPVLNLLLADSIQFWDSRQSEGGRWLEQYEKENPQKASMIRNILVNEIKFSDTSESISNNNIIKYALPVGSAIAGFAISRSASASNVIQALCMFAPAAKAYPIANNMLNTSRDNKRRELIQKYMNQLDKYRVSVESILQDM